MSHTAIGSDGDFRLILSEGADHEDCIWTLQQRDGSWTNAVAVVPEWRQETMKEKFDFRERDRDTGRDKLKFPISTDGLKWDSSHLTGKVSVRYRVDQTWAERMPPGGAAQFTYEGFYSPLDLYWPVAHQRERVQNYEIEAHSAPGRWRGELVLHGLLTNVSITVSVLIPPDAARLERPVARGWNSGIHELDSSGLQVVDGKLTGEARLTLNPDPYFPKEAAQYRLLFDSVIRNGVVDGTFKALLTKKETVAVGGEVFGKQREAAKGDVRPLFQGPDATTGQVVGELWPALVGRYRSDGAFGTSQGPIEGWACAPSKSPAIPVPLMRGYGRPADDWFGPYYGTNGWQRLPEWQVTGPWPQSAPPPASPEGDTQTVATDPDGTLWAPVWTVDPKVKANKRIGKPDSWWWATTELKGAKEGPVWLAIEALDFAEVWLNDRLLWTGAEREYVNFEPGSAIFQAVLHGGVNTLKARVRDDRGGSWLRVLVAEPNVVPRTKVEPTKREVIPPPAATTPLAWDLASGKNVRWKTPTPPPDWRQLNYGADSSFVLPNDPVQLTVAGGAVLLNAEPHNLICLDADTGRERWRADSTLPDAPVPATGHNADTLPVSDGQRVWVHYRSGVAASYDLSGKQLWITRTQMSKAWTFIVGDRLLVCGRALDDKSATTVLALAAGTGKELWRVTVPGGYDVRPYLLPCGALVLASGQVIDPSTGATLVDRLNLIDKPFWNGVSQEGDTLVWVSTFGMQAATFWRTTDGQLGHRVMWITRRAAAHGAAGADPGLRVGQRLLVWRRHAEFSKHDPAYGLELDWYDAVTGAPIGQIKPVIRGTNVPLQPVAAGGYLYLADARGGPSSGGEFSERRISVVKLDPEPVVVARNLTPDLAGVPVVVGSRLYLRLNDAVVCLESRDTKWEAEQVAATIFGGIMPEPAAADIPASQPLVTPSGTGTPRVLLDDAYPITGQLPDLTAWLVAGPFTDEPTTSDGVPEVGTKWVVLDPALRRQSREWANWNRLDGWQMRRVTERIDLAALAGADTNALFQLFTVIDNPHPRVLLPNVQPPGMTGTLGGQPLVPGRGIKVEPGLHPLWITVRPSYFLAQKPLPPIHVPAAIAGNALQTVVWPKEWIVTGPFPEVGVKPSADVLADGQAVATVDNAVVFKRTIEPQSFLYAQASVSVPAAGYLVVNASADWFMTWWCDGREVYTTRGRGNGRGATDPIAHTFSVPVSKGDHVLTVAVKPGSKGWSFSSVGGFTDGNPHVLAEKFPNPTGVRNDAAPHEVAINFSQADTPSLVRATWRADVARHRAALEWIVAQLPGSAAATRAEKLLSELTTR